MSRATDLLREALRDLREGRWREAKLKLKIVANRGGTDRSKARHYLKLLQVLESHGEPSTPFHRIRPASATAEALERHGPLEPAMPGVSVATLRRARHAQAQHRLLRTAIKILPTWNLDEAIHLFERVQAQGGVPAKRAREHLNFVRALNRAPELSFETVQAIGGAFGISDLVLIEMSAGAIAMVDRNIDGIGVFGSGLMKRLPVGVSNDRSYAWRSGRTRELPTDLAGVLQKEVPGRTFEGFAIPAPSANLPPQVGGVEAGSRPTDSSDSEGLAEGTQQPIEDRTSPSAPTAFASESSLGDTPEIRRTPHLLTVPGRPLRDGEPFEIEVWLDTSAFGPGEDGEPIAIGTELPEIELQVWCLTSAHFLVQEPNDSLLVRRSDEESRTSRGRFLASVCAGASQLPQSAWICALFAYDGRPCGSVRRSVEIEERPPSANPEGPGDDGAYPGVVEIELLARPADLQIWVVSTPGKAAPYDCRVQSRHHSELAEGASGEWHLDEQKARDLVFQAMRAFTDKYSPDFNRAAALRGVGEALFEAAPEVFRSAFWRLIDANAPLKTIAIVSDESAIPWQLMIPSRVGTSSQFRALGVEYSVGRWTSRRHVAPRQQLLLRNGLIVAPTDSKLEKAEAEVRMLGALLPGCSRVVPAKLEKLNDMCAASKPSLLHFVCHGKSCGNGMQNLTLEAGETFSHFHVRGSSGIRTGVGDGSSLVFLNACEIGRAEPALVGVGGFAEEFMRIGAGVVVAPLWSVKDTIAPEVAVAFYGGIRDRPDIPLAEIIREIRSRSYADPKSEDSWGAYTFYGDPLARAILAAK